MRFNFVSILAYILVGVFTYLVITKFTDDPAIFINPEGLVVVVGGLMVAGLASFPFINLLEAIKGAWRAISRSVYIPVEEAREVVRIATIGQRGLARLENELESVENEFMRTGIELMLDGVTPKIFIALMQKRVTEYQERCSRSVNVMLTLSKFAPALGLAATVLGLVQLLTKLGAAEMDQLGHGMAVALSGTFYGIMVANLFFQPLAELIQMKTESDVKSREMVLEGLHAILERQEPLLIGELVNSYLPDSHRINFTEELESIAGESRIKTEAAA
jgi:chemotaxis protein MotA